MAEQKGLSAFVSGKWLYLVLSENTTSSPFSCTEAVKYERKADPRRPKSFWGFVFSWKWDGWFFDFRPKRVQGGGVRRASDGFRLLYEGFRLLHGGFRHLYEGLRHLYEGFRHLYEGFRHLYEGFRHAYESFRHLYEGFRLLYEGFRLLYESFRHAYIGGRQPFIRFDDGFICSESKCVENKRISGCFSLLPCRIALPAPQLFFKFKKNTEICSSNIST